MAKLYHAKNRLSGFDTLSAEMQATVTDAFLHGKIVEPTVAQPVEPDTMNKRPTKKPQPQEDNEDVASPPHSGKKRTVVKFAPSDEETGGRKKAKKGRAVKKTKSSA
jgi:hypothetical protein